MFAGSLATGAQRLLDPSADITLTGVNCDPVQALQLSCFLPADRLRGDVRCIVFRTLDLAPRWRIIRSDELARAFGVSGTELG